MTKMYQKWLISNNVLFPSFLSLLHCTWGVWSPLVASPGKAMTWFLGPGVGTPPSPTLSHLNGPMRSCKPTCLLRQEHWLMTLADSPGLYLITFHNAAPRVCAFVQVVLISKGMLTSFKPLSSWGVIWFPPSGLCWPWFPTSSAWG